MKLLRASRCGQCGRPIQVPGRGSYRIACVCGFMNVYHGIPARKWEKPEPKREPAPRILPEPRPEPEVIEDLSPVVEVLVEDDLEPLPEWNSRMRKDELLTIAQEWSLDATPDMTKAQIIDALKDLEASRRVTR